ncbi:MAG: adenylate/guanylate cyclase domain-containing protein [Acidobacteriia bacterium]|nr:adenylate/guanylate cyclase domain-containing protein [Terriglobia bacterium]
MRHLPKPGIAGLVRFLRKYRAGLVISGAVCVISLGLYVALYLVPHPSPALRFLTDIELRTLDTRFQLRGPRRPGPEVVIVAIDQKSQDVLGRWPFPRTYFAQTLDVLREAGARVVSFDVNFPQPDQNSALQALRKVRAQYEKVGGGRSAFNAELRALEAEADNDAKFAEALSRFDNVILGYFFLPKEEVQAQDQERLKEFLNYLSFQAYPQIINPQYAYKFEGKPYAGLSPNLPRFAEYAKNFGYFNVLADPDGVVRREPAILRFGENFYPSLDVASILAYMNRPLEEVSVFFNRNGLERINIGSIVLPTDPQGFVQIDFHGRAGTFPTYSLSDVVQRKIPPGAFKDHLVLIGPTATGIADMAVTPLQTEAFPGVEVHANFIANVLENRFIRRGPRENLVDLGFILLFGLAAGILLTVVPPARATAVLVVLLGLFLWLSYYLFATQRVWIAVFLPTATLTVNYAGIISYRFFFEERERKRVHGAFAQYVAPSVIKQLLDRPELMRLGGEERELTAMFSDIRNFTGISEGMTPAALVDLLNGLLSEMTEVIFAHWGTLDKYIGDSIMAFWGSPYPQADHAERACQAALEMLRTLKTARARWQAEGRPELNIGIGINTGPMLVGNMGSKRRFNFTVMGDNVNLASRLEGLNKTFGTRLIVSESTYHLVQDKILGRELDWIRVKGKVRPVRIYELLDASEDAKNVRDLVGRFHKGLEAYRSAQWETALERFGDILRDYPEDGPTRTFLQRCWEYHEEPPTSEWDGVYVMLQK